MAKRPNVPRNYKPIADSEMTTIAQLYYAFISSPTELAKFTAADAGVDAAWLTNFNTSITNVGNIVPSKTVLLKNKDVTATIKTNSKASVKYGKVLTYWLEKTFTGQTGLIASFGVVATNDKMRAGETEGLLTDVKNIVDQINLNKAALLLKGYPASNLADYEGLYSVVDALNVQQELNKKLVPENTDAAILLRNVCYSYIQTLLTLKDIVYYEDLNKRHEWALATNLNQIRASKKDDKK